MYRSIGWMRVGRLVVLLEPASCAADYGRFAWSRGCNRRPCRRQMALGGSRNRQFLRTKRRL